MILELHIPGVPAAKGSFRVFRNKATGAPIVAKDSPATESWQRTCKWFAEQLMRRPGMQRIDGPVGVKAALVLPRAKMTKRGLLRSTRWAPDVAPDVDKLLRTTLDGLNKILFEDDCRIVRLETCKVYERQVAHWPSAGVYLSITPVVEGDLYWERCV